LWGDDIVTIGNNAFEGCTSLATMDLRNVTSIGDFAFADCSTLASIDVSNVTTLGSSAFAGCDSLNSITYDRTTIASADSDFVVVNKYGTVVTNGTTTITKNDGGFLTQ
jgi:hypothetical protein